MNSVALSGRIVKDPNIHITNNGDKVASFTIAVHRPMTRDVTDFVECVAWDERAEFIERNFKKDSKVEISGILTTREYEKNGIRRKVTEIRINDAAFGPDISSYITEKAENE